MVGFLLRAAAVALGLWVAGKLLPAGGLSFDSTTTLVLAALLLGVVNAVVRPIAFILTLPITLVTLGLFLVVLNAAMLGLVALLLPGFKIADFWTAVGAALIVSLVSWAASSLIGSRGIERFGAKR
jgi:putative membrane protein